VYFGIAAILRKRSASLAGLDASALPVVIDPIKLFAQGRGDNAIIMNDAVFI